MKPVHPPTRDEIQRSKKLIELYGESMRLYPYTWLMNAVLEGRTNTDVVKDYRALTRYMMYLEEKSEFEKRSSHSLNVEEQNG